MNIPYAVFKHKTEELSPPSVWTAQRHRLIWYVKLAFLDLINNSLQTKTVLILHHTFIEQNFTQNIK